MAEPREFVDKATGKTVGFFCAKCLCATAGMLIGGHVGEKDERIAAAREEAAEHCEPKLCACGAERERNHTVCASCRQQQWAAEREAKEVAAFESAEKVKASDWTGEYVWSERFEGIFDDIDELRERYADMEEEPPEFVWECEEEVLTLDAGDILYSALDREGATFLLESMSSAPKEAFQQALDAWLEKNPMRWWVPAHRRAVLLREDG